MSTTIYGGYAKSNGKNFIKVYLTYTISSSNTETSVTWSAGTHVDSGYTTNAKITVSCGGKSSTVDNKGWGGGNHSMVSGSNSWTRTTSASSKTLTAKLTLANGNTSSVTATINIPVLPNWKVTYNANQGTGAPSAQTKYYEKTLTISSAKPKRTGYTFNYWKSTRSDGTYHFSPGGQTNYNGAQSLVAQWTANKYTINYNNNGGTGTIAATTKTYGSSCTLSNGSGFKKTNYKFKGWATTQARANAGTVDYGGGAKYSVAITSNQTLYAVWELDYIASTVKNLKVNRIIKYSDGSTIINDDGEFLQVGFNYTLGSQGGTTLQATCNISISGTTIDSSTFTSSSGSYLSPVLGEGTLPEEAEIYQGPYSKDKTYTVTITLTDTAGTTSVSVIVPTAIYPIDLYADNTNAKVYMGVMHKYVTGQLLTLPTTYIDGKLYFNNNTIAYINVSPWANTNNMYYFTDGYHAFYTSATANTAPTDTFYISNTGADLRKGDFSLNGNSYIITETKNWDNLTVGATSTEQFSYSVAKTGYTPIGIAGFDIDNAGTSGVNMHTVWFSACRISGTNVVMQMRNNGSSAAKIKLWATILYKAN